MTAQENIFFWLKAMQNAGLKGNKGVLMKKGTLLIRTGSVP